MSETQGQPLTELVRVTAERDALLRTVEAWVTEQCPLREALQIARAWLVENHHAVASGVAWAAYTSDLARIDAALAPYPPPFTQPPTQRT
jgi:hypothetical protein